MAMALSQRPELLAYAIYALTALAIMLPLLGPGFILTLDMVFVPQLPMPEQVTSSYLFHAALHMLNFVMPSDVLQKIMLVGILLLSSIGMHRLMRVIAAKQVIDWGIYIASIFFAINPFTYSRFMAGQYAVLLGYALLPWFARQLILFARKPNWKQAFKLGGLVTLIGIVSIHTLVLVGILMLVAATLGWKQLKKYIQPGLAAAGVFVVLSSYWLVPLALGQGKTAATVASFTAADTQAFATLGGSPLGRAGNIMRLQGFWAEGRDLYLLPQDRAVLWGLMMLVIIGLCITGAVNLRGRSVLPWLGISALIGLVLAAGTWPALTGLREPHKLVGLVALAYSVFLAFGINALLARLHKKNMAAYVSVAALLFVLPFLVTRVMLWGFDGQLAPRHYPPDWARVRDQLHQDTSGSSVLFLPWYQYMSFGFSGDRIIASPARPFFGSRTIVSQNPELGGASGGPPAQAQQTITQLLRGKQNPAGTNIKYILLAKELDYQKYNYLDKQPGLTIIADYPTLKLYKNQLWRQP